MWALLFVCTLSSDGGSGDDKRIHKKSQGTRAKIAGV